MRVVEDRGRVDDDRIVALVLTGDGKTEFRRLKPVARRFGGDEALWFPQRPERYLPTRGRQRRPTTAEKAGLDALDALELYKSRYGVTDYLFLVDREHVDEAVGPQLEAKLREVSTGETVSTTRLADGAFDCSCRVGSRDLSVHVVAFGDGFGFIEDCVAELLESEWGNSIEATGKDEFKRRVNEAVAGGTFRNLVEDARMDDVRSAFPNLCSVLEAMQS